MSDRGSQQFEHTADLGIEFWAPSHAQALEEASYALMQLISERGSIGDSEERRLEIATVDAATGMVEWLNELLFLAMVERFLVAKCTITASSERIVARVWGEVAPELVRSELKSVTYHEAALAVGEGGVWRGRAIIDT